MEKGWEPKYFLGSGAAGVPRAPENGLIRAKVGASVKAVASDAAERAGLSLTGWLARAIIEQAEKEVGSD